LVGEKKVSDEEGKSFAAAMLKKFCHLRDFQLGPVL
jgi:hypothetical protein